MFIPRLAAIFLCFGVLVQANAQITVSRGTNLSVDASRDGRLAIDLGGEIWVVPGGGGDARQLTNGLRSAQRPRWSPDGRKLVYQAIADGQQGLWIYDLDSNDSRRLDTASNLDLHPSWSADGERILYSSDIHGAGLDLWELDVATGLRWRLSDRPGDETGAAWSKNGRDLVYVHHYRKRWSLILRRHSEPEEVLLTSAEKIAAPAWRPDGSLITFFRESGGATTIEMVILSTPRLVRTYASGENYIVAPVSWLDRNRMYYTADGQIRQRQFDAWSSKPLHFSATLQPVISPAATRKRQPLRWLDEPQGELVIHAARLFDGINDGYLLDRDIVISGGRITAIEEHRERIGSIVIDMGDLAVLPGLIDADARLPTTLVPGHGPDLLTYGITTIVGSSSDAVNLNAIWSGKDIPGPRLLAAEQWAIGQTPRPELDVTAAVLTSRSTGLAVGAALPTQLRAMTLAGLTSQQTLRAMGVNAAAAMLADPYLGRIATGAAADLVLVAGDPLANIQDLLNVVAVVRNGRFYSVSGLVDRAKRAESVE